MSNAIFCCGCPGVDKQSLATVKTAFHKTPPIYVGHSISDALLGTTGNIQEYIKSLARNRGKFAYYMEWDMDGKVTLQYNLLLRRRII